MLMLLLTACGGGGEKDQAAALQQQYAAVSAATLEAVRRLDDWRTRLETGVERGIMKMMGAGCSSPVGINAEADGDTVRVRAVSYGYSEVPRRVERELSVDYVMDELLDIAEYLTARRDSI